MQLPVPNLLNIASIQLQDIVLALSDPEYGVLKRFWSKSKHSLHALALSCIKNVEKQNLSTRFKNFKKYINIITKIIIFQSKNHPTNRIKK